MYQTAPWAAMIAARGADISKGEWIGGVADVALVDAAARLGAGLEALEFLTLTGRIGARAQGRRGLVLTCKDRLVHYYAKFGFVSEGVSSSTHGGVVWYQMRLTF